MSPAPARIIFATSIVIQAILWSQSRYATHTTQQLALRNDANYYNTPVKRHFDDFLMTKGNYSLFNEPEKTCRPLAFPPIEQCLHVQESCPESETMLGVNYIQNYFCTDTLLRPLKFIWLIVWLLFLFSTLGITASEFFIPNLATISNILRLDADVAGATFLAFGNASPDVFSTFSAMRAHSGALAIGELLGAASFIVSCVVGSMCIIQPFKVERWPFLRDVGFFTTAVAMLLVILWDGRIRPVEAGSMVVLYGFYVLVVAVGSWRERRRLRREQYEEQIRGEYRDDGRMGFGPFRDDDNSISPSTLSVPSPLSTRGRAISHPGPLRLKTNFNIPTRSRTPSPSGSVMHHQLAPMSLVGAIEFRDVIAGLQDRATSPALSRFESQVSPYAGGHYHTRSNALSLDGLESIALEDMALDERAQLPTHYNHHFQSQHQHQYSHRQHQDHQHPRPPFHQRSASTPSKILTSNDNGPTVGITPPTATLNGAHRPTAMSGDEASIPPILHRPATPPDPSTSSTPSSASTINTPTSAATTTSCISTASSLFSLDIHSLRRLSGQIFRTLFPSLCDFHKHGWQSNLANVLAAPAVMMLIVTLPVANMPQQAIALPLDDVHGNSNKLAAGSIMTTDGFLRPPNPGEALLAEHGMDLGENDLTMGALDIPEELRYNKWLMAVQCVLSTLFCTTVLLKGSNHFGPIIFGAGFAGFLVAMMVLMFTDTASHSSALMFRASLGFFVAIVWIMAIADEVVIVLQTIAYIFGMSDAMIGLTIFAVGNSLADWVANTSVASINPIMGFSACFGSPMINILLGVGISGTYVIHQQKAPYELHFTNTLFVSTLGLLALLATTLVFVPMNDYFLPRRWGWFLIGSYVVIMSVNVWVERGASTA